MPSPTGTRFLAADADADADADAAAAAAAIFWFLGTCGVAAGCY